MPVGRDVAHEVRQPAASTATVRIVGMTSTATIMSSIQ